MAERPKYSNDEFIKVSATHYVTRENLPISMGLHAFGCLYPSKKNVHFSLLVDNFLHF